MKLRLVLSAVTVVLTGWINLALNKSAPIISGQAAVYQLNDSNVDYATAQAGMAFNGGGISVGVVALILLALWWKPLRKAMSAVAPILAALAFAGPAMAFYDVTDNPEFIEIMPSETAFAIPEQGANKAGQAAFMSEQYLSDNKVAMKRFQIPHVLIKTAIGSRDYYVPGTKLMIVNRAPATREWRSGARGTSATDQSFSMETADSIGLSFGVVFAANVREEDAAKFAYNFGAKATQNKSNDPAVTFASVIYGRSLEDVVDDNVRHDVQSALADEVGKRDTATVIKEKSQIVAAALKTVQTKYGPLGINITTLGLATQLNFDNSEIQKAIDGNFIYAKRAQSAEQIAKYLATERQRVEIANLELMGKAQADAVAKSSVQINGGLPSWVVIPDSIASLFTGWVKPSAGK